MQKLIILVILGIVLVFGLPQFLNLNINQINPDSTSTSKPSPTSLPTPILAPTPQSSPRLILIDVPFTSQAPFAQWKDPRQQDACEEAVVLMAMHWVKNEKIASPQAAKDEILKLSKYQEDTFGDYHDTSAQDTAERLIKGYYHYNNYQLKALERMEEIVDPLNQGNIVIVPTNGQALGNPYFTAPGPDRHNLVIKGYDPILKQFITNDPGVRQGESYRYNQEVLFKAIRDYPTGNHLPITEIKKVMIVIKK